MIAKQLAVFSLALLAIGNKAQEIKEPKKTAGKAETWEAKIKVLDEVWVELFQIARCDTDTPFEETSAAIASLKERMEVTLAEEGELGEAQAMLVDMVEKLYTQLLEGARYCWGGLWESAAVEVVDDQMPFMALLAAMQNVKAELELQNMKAELEVTKVADCLPKPNILKRAGYFIFRSLFGKSPDQKAADELVSKTSKVPLIGEGIASQCRTEVAEREQMEKLVWKLSSLTQKKTAAKDLPEASLPAQADTKHAENLIMFMAQVLGYRVAQMGQCYTEFWPSSAVQAATNYTLATYNLDIARTWCSPPPPARRRGFFR